MTTFPSEEKNHETKKEPPEKIASLFDVEVVNVPPLKKFPEKEQPPTVAPSIDEAKVGEIVCTKRPIESDTLSTPEGTPVTVVAIVDQKTGPEGGKLIQVKTPYNNRIYNLDSNDLRSGSPQDAQTFVETKYRQDKDRYTRLLALDKFPQLEETVLFEKDSKVGGVEIKKGDKARIQRDPDKTDKYRLVINKNDEEIKSAIFDQATRTNLVTKNLEFDKSPYFAKLTSGTTIVNRGIYTGKILAETTTTAISVVAVLGRTQDNNRLLVMTPDGTKGFVLATNLVRGTLLARKDNEETKDLLARVEKLNITPEA